MICVQLRFSLSFSIPRCRYPITTSASTTFSPSRRRTTRNTPCVLGCCGPMLITSSLVSNIAPWWIGVAASMSLPFVLFDICLVPRLPQLEPVERVFHQQLARPFERIVLALRESLPVLGHQNPPPIGVARDVHPEHVVHLALEPVGVRPDRPHRPHRLTIGGLD